jgi:alkylation response protein AidB-like acyl-CoA dehydrogenase
VSRDTQAHTEQHSRKVAEAAREQDWQQPSFGKELFLGRLRLDLIHPHPRPTEQERRKGEAFLARLEAFLREHVDPLQIERDAKIPDEVVRGLGELGAFGIKIDERYGGLGLSQVYYNRALALAASAHSSISVLLSAHQSIGVPEPVRLFGTEDQQRRILPGVAKDQVSAFLLTEPDVGSDPARMRTTATPTEDGSAYVLNGSKLWTTNGVIADMLVVMAVVPRSQGHRGGITAFVVDAHTPGITVTHRNQFMGLRGIENGVTVFDNVRVPVADRLGEEGRGLKIALQTLNTGRLSLPAICCAAAKWSLRIARQWSNERVQWGKPIGKHEAVAAKLAFIAGMAYGMESMLELASALADDKRNDIRIEAALTKLYTSEMAWLVADELVQLRGGRGYETATSLAARGERPVGAEQGLRDLRINRVFEGSTEIMHLFIAREAVDQHLSVAGGLIDPETGLAGKARAAASASRFYPRSPQTCASWSGPAGGSPARPSTAWPAGRAGWSASSGSWAGSSTSARSCSRSAPPACGPGCWSTTARPRPRRRSSWPSCSAGAPAAGSSGSSTTCGPTTTPATTRPPSASCAATTPGWRRASSTPPATAR